MSYTAFTIGVFIIVSLINSYLDFRTFHISLILNYIGLVICVVAIFIIAPSLLLNKTAGGVLLFLLFVLIRLLTHKGLGLGDIHYCLFCGFIAGCPGFIICSLISSITGILYFLFIRLILKKEDAFKTRIPFIPMMFLGTLVGMPVSTYLINIL